MIIDVNTYIGHYPFRKLVNNTAQGLLSVMDASGIDKACVCSLSGIYYRDVMTGNYELLEQIRGYEDRFIPFCIWNPDYAGAEQDLEECVRLGFKGVRLFPKQHKYALNHPLLSLCAAHNLPVQLTVFLEDLRQRHPMDVAEAISPKEVQDAASAHPNINFILSNGHHQQYASVLKGFTNVYYDLGRVENLGQFSFQNFYKNTDANHVLFGTGAPMQYTAPNLLKLHTLPVTDHLTEDEIECISHRNIERLLAL